MLANPRFWACLALATAAFFAAERMTRRHPKEVLRSGVLFLEPLNPRASRQILSILEAA